MGQSLRVVLGDRVMNSTETPLNVAVRGDRVLVLSPKGEDIELSVRAAQRSAQRLLDAIAIAEGRLPTGQTA